MRINVLIIRKSQFKVIMRKFFKLIRHCEIVQQDVSKTSIELSNITLFTSLISILFRIVTIYTLDFMIWLLFLFLIGGQGRILYTYGRQRLRYYFFGDVCTMFSIYGTLITLFLYLLQFISLNLEILPIVSILCVGIILIMIITITFNLVKESIQAYYDMYKKVCIPERKYIDNGCRKCKYYNEVILK